MRRRVLALALLAVLLVGAIALAAQRAGDAVEEAEPREGQGDPAGALAWDALAEVPAGRTESCAVGAAGKVWLIAGILESQAEARRGRVDVYDPATDAWASGPDLPLPVHHAACLAVGDRILVMGGFVGLTPFVPIATTFSLDAANPTAWTRGPELPAPRGGHAGATDGAKVWIFGGARIPPTTLATRDLTLDASAYELDLASGQWRRIADLPDARDHLAGAFAAGKVWAIGGRDLTLDTNTGRVDVYDPATGEWAEGPVMPSARGGIAGGVVGDRVFVAGGESPQDAFVTVESLDAANGTWRAEPDLPEARHGMGSLAVLGADVYAAAGGPTPSFAFSATNYRLRTG